MTQRHQFWVKNKWWLHINKKRNHAVLHVVWFHISKGSERWKNSTITSVLTENWEHLHDSLTGAFTKHNKISAAFTTLELDGVSTELTTDAKQVHYELWEMCPIFEQNSQQMYES